MNINTIIVATDFSAEARVALDHAVNIAGHTSAEIVLIHANPTLEPPPDISGADDWRLAMYNHLESCQRELEDLRVAVSGRYERVSGQVIDDIPAEGVFRAAQERDADLVIVGTHGRTGIKRFLLGSQSERILRHCDRDVMVARESTIRAGGYRRILVPTDFSARSERAVERAIGLVASGGSVEVRHWWNSPVFGPIPDPSVIGRQLHRHASERGAALVQRYQSDKYHISFVASEGFAKHGIQSRLEDEGYDLVVMGSHGRRGARRLLLGSVAETTARHAPCSVYIVKRAGDGDEADDAEP